MSVTSLFGIVRLSYLSDNKLVAVRTTNRRTPLAPLAPHYDSFGMRKEQLARRLAKESGISTAAAADQLDRIISDILARVRRGESAALPGFGTFKPGLRTEFQFDPSQPLERGRGATGKTPR